MSRSNGGPAFPQQKGVALGDRAVIESSGGMTLLDYFAGQVIGQCHITVAKDLDAPDPSEVAEAASRFARTAYAIADAMLVEREQSR